MKAVPIESLKPGIKFSKPIYWDRDTIFLAERVPLTKADIDKLKKFGVNEILTNGSIVDENPVPQDSKKQSAYATERNDDESLRLRTLVESISHERTNFLSIHKQSTDMILKTYRLAAEGKVFDLQPFRTAAEEIADFTRRVYSITPFLFSYPISSYYLYTHVVNATFFATYIGCLLEMTRPKLLELAQASLFADIGMSFVPSVVSEKPGKLGEGEEKTMMKHTILGYQYLNQKLKVKLSLASVALDHHENWDGTGYPQRKKGNDIEEYTRIYSIADEFTALIENRPHRKAILPYDALKILIGQDMHKFDLNIVRLVLKNMSLYPVGSFVELDNGSRGIVLEGNDDKALRPKIRVYSDENNIKLQLLRFVDLAQETNQYIKSALPNEEIY